MRLLLLLLIASGYSSVAPAQLVGDCRWPVKLATETVDGIDLDGAIRFIDFGIYFDGGSHGANFKAADGTKFTLFFPHYGYWTEIARTNLQQPIVFLRTHSEGDYWVEVVPGSKLNDSLLSAIDANLKRGIPGRNNRATLVRIRQCVHDRKPLKEISDRIHLFTKDRKDGG